jgi:hypothetical protein
VVPHGRARRGVTSLLAVRGERVFQSGALDFHERVHGSKYALSRVDASCGRRVGSTPQNEVRNEWGRIP